MKNYFVSGALALTLAACGSVSTNPAIKYGESEQVEKADAVAKVAKAFCNKFKECKGYSAEASYKSETECLTEQKSTFHDKWDDEKCATVTGGKVNACQNRLETTACGSGNILDDLNSLIDCRAGNVCE